MDKNIKLFCFTDASYITEGDSKCQLGNCFFITKDSGAIYSTSKKDTTVSHSSTEAELKALDLGIRTVIYMRIMLKDMGYEQKLPTEIFIDNKSAKELSETLKSTHKTKHLNMRINFIREQINKNIIFLTFVSTENQVADILTKALSKEKFEKFSNLLLNGFNNSDPKK